VLNVVKATSGSAEDVVLFCRLLFGENYMNANSNKRALVTSMRFPISPNVPVQKVLEINGERYLLSHAHITILGPGGAHAITGFMCGDRSYLSDSNQDYILDKYDWVNAPSPAPVINEYSVRTYAATFVPNNSVLIYIKENSQQFVPEMNTLGTRRNVVALYGNLLRKVWNANSVPKIANVQKELNKLPNKNSLLAKQVRSAISQAINDTAKMWEKSLRNIKNQISLTNIRMYINRMNSPPYSNYREFKPTRNHLARLYENRVRVLVNNALAGGNRNNIAVFINRFKNDQHPVIKNAVARLRAYEPKSPKVSCFGRLCRSKNVK
jgi:hypothetical protein